MVAAGISVVVTDRDETISVLIRERFGCIRGLDFLKCRSNIVVVFLFSW